LLKRGKVTSTRLWVGNALSRGKKRAPEKPVTLCFLMAGWTGLEPATSGVTGRRSNHLNYHPKLGAGPAPVGYW
jgi:hypothetical protein